MSVCVSVAVKVSLSLSQSLCLCRNPTNQWPVEEIDGWVQRRRHTVPPRLHFVCREQQLGQLRMAPALQLRNNFRQKHQRPHVPEAVALVALLLSLVVFPDLDKRLDKVLVWVQRRERVCVYVCVCVWVGVGGWVCE